MEIMQSCAVPMLVKHTMAMFDETDRMMMVDTEKLQEEIIDVDSDDLKDSLEVVEYVYDIYDSYRKLESSCYISPNYMDRQSDLNGRMRAILIDWLIQLHHKSQLKEETLFLTVNIVDRFLDRHEIVKENLQLVGIAAMLLACKYEENRVCAPTVDAFVYITDYTYTRKEILEMERLMANKLQFNMAVPTPYVFMRRFLKVAGSDRKLRKKEKTQLELLSFFIIELSLVEYAMLKYPPSLLAAAAIYTAHCTLHRHKHWSKTFEFHTKYSEDQLLECSRMMVWLHRIAGAGELNGVHMKYNTSEFGFAANAEPASFLI